MTIFRRGAEGTGSDLDLFEHGKRAKADCSPAITGVKALRRYYGIFEGTKLNIKPAMARRDDGHYRSPPASYDDALTPRPRTGTPRSAMAAYYTPRRRAAGT